MDAFIPCTGVLGFFVVLFGFIALMRFMSYKETLALAEKGLVHPEKAHKNGGKLALGWGIVITAAGLALCVGLYPLGWLIGAGRVGSETLSFPLGFGPWMLIGIVPTFIGLALILIYVLTREGKPKQPPQSPSPEE